MSITLRQLEIFIAIAETAQVTKASKKLFVTQSAVSMALSELENQLGGPLFNRQGRNLLLNDQGRYLLTHAKDILLQVSNIESFMSDENDTLVGTIEIVATPTLGNYILPYLIGAFQRIHPKIQIKTRISTSHFAENEIVKGSADLGFVEERLEYPELIYKPWFKDELVILAGSTDPLAHEKVFDVKKDLKKVKWVMSKTGSETAIFFNKKMQDYINDLNVLMELESPEAVKRVVESGVGIACLSSLTICREVENGWLTSLRVKGVDMRRQLYILRRRDRVVKGAITEFLSFCEVMTIYNQANISLSSPWKLQSLLAHYSLENRKV